MISVEHRLRKVIGITYASPITLAEVDTFARRVREVIAPLPRVVFIVDFTALHVLPEEESKRTTAIMRADNPKVERSAFLLPQSAVSSLQTERMIREAGNPMRRSFGSARKLLDWVSECLDAEELAAAQAFFAGRA